MSGMPTLYCRACDAFREVESWRERGDALVIALEPCGHQIRRHASIEWAVHEHAA